MQPAARLRTQLLIRFGYDGARFSGLQPQGPAIPTAGYALKVRLTDAAGEPPKGLNFAARTDAGVHAISNVSTCWWRERPADGLLERVAAPRDDGLTNVVAAFVPPEVHARGSARGKLYRYVVEDGVPGEIDAAHAHAWRIGPRVDVARMQEAAELLVGTHDFTSLRARSCTAKNPVKTISALTIARVAAEQRSGSPGRDAVVVEIVGDGFLRKMVRNIVALLCEVGSGWRSVADVPAILAARDRGAAGLCAPPGGLTLVHVGCLWPPDGSGLIGVFEADAARTRSPE